MDEPYYEGINDFKNTVNAYILLGNASLLSLGILIWQLINLNYFYKISCYIGLLVIAILHGLIIGTFFYAVIF
jgi:hypothetical protein